MAIPAISPGDSLGLRVLPLASPAAVEVGSSEVVEVSLSDVVEVGLSELLEVGGF